MLMMSLITCCTVVAAQC